mmetsp:Transcript_29233/g.68365  ORF Transcript_29233/g.68365 Transcript_29233/m.68365 type:complete len:283 (+) Transcript_29233:6032-6880(+)
MRGGVRVQGGKHRRGGRPAGGGHGGPVALPRDETWRQGALQLHRIRPSLRGGREQMPCRCRVRGQELGSADRWVHRPRQLRAQREPPVPLPPGVRHGQPDPARHLQRARQVLPDDMRGLFQGGPFPEPQPAALRAPHRPNRQELVRRRPRPEVDADEHDRAAHGASVRERVRQAGALVHGVRAVVRCRQQPRHERRRKGSARQRLPPRREGLARGGFVRTAAAGPWHDREGCRAIHLDPLSPEPGREGVGARGRLVWPPGTRSRRVFQPAQPCLLPRGGHRE